jgi:hypothetical protein
MSSADVEPADPIAKGIIPSAKQGLKDLVKWKQRAVITNDFGETHVVWQKPAKLTNPITLLMQLSARDVRMTITHNSFHPEKEMLTPISGCFSSADSLPGQQMHLISTLSLFRPSSSRPTTIQTTPISQLPSPSPCSFVPLEQPSSASQEIDMDENTPWSLT